MCLDGHMKAQCTSSLHRIIPLWLHLKNDPGYHFNSLLMKRQDEWIYPGGVPELEGWNVRRPAVNETFKGWLEKVITLLTVSIFYCKVNQLSILII
jgi:hypothetical protein